MATNWDKVKYITRIRPDSDDGRFDECNDAVDDCEVQLRINDELGGTYEDGLEPPKVRRINQSSSLFQPKLKRGAYDSLCLSVPQDIGRRNQIPYDQEKSRANAEKDASRKRSVSANSLFYGAEINGNIPPRTKPLLKINRRVLVKDLFTKQEEEDIQELKVKKARYIIKRNTREIF